jgi:hypothetical protein
LPLDWLFLHRFEYLYVNFVFPFLTVHVHDVQ